ncbi:MAG: hypothetical protein ACM3MM_05535 [Acidobacteriota bacterium]
MSGLTETELQSLVGHRFAGGRYRIEHWENWLLTDCTGRDPLPDGLVHPIVLFHVPILGVGTSITELFELGGVSGPGSVGLEGYDWEYFGPLHEDVEYRMEGGIVSVERTTDDAGRTVDRMAFEITLFDEADRMAARITNRWVLRR